MQTGKEEPDSARSEDVEGRAAGTSSLQEHVRKMVSVAKLQIHELNQTIEALVQSGLGKEQKLDWTGLSIDLTLQGHKVRRMRRGAILIVLGIIIYALIGIQNLASPSDALHYGFTIIAGLAIAWITWRLALRSARRLAFEVEEVCEEGIIPDPMHPRVLFGSWIPKAHRSAYDWIRGIFRRVRK